MVGQQNVIELIKFSDFTKTTVQKITYYVWYNTICRSHHITRVAVTTTHTNAVVSPNRNFSISYVIKYLCKYFLPET